VISLDIRTLSFIAMLTSVLLAAGLLLVNRIIANDPSLRLWSRGATLCSAGYILFVARGAVPDLFSIVVANTLLILGTGWLYLGNRQYFDLRRERPWYWVMAAVGAAAIFYFTYLAPSLPARIVVLSVATASILLPSAVVMVRSGDSSDRSVRWFVAGAYFAVAVFLSMRAVVTPFSAPGSDFMAVVSPIQTLSLVFGIGFNVALAIGLPLLVSGRMQRRLIENEAHLNSILENASVGITFVRDRCQIWTNRGMCDLLGYTAKEMANQNTRMFYVTQQAYEQLGKEADVVLASGARYTTEQQMMRRDGRTIWMRISGKSVASDHSTNGSIWVFEEITDRKQAEAQLYETLIFNEAILHNSPVAMGVYRGSGQCVLANQAYATLVGATRDQLLEQNFRAIPTWQQSGLLDDCLATLADGNQRQREGHVTTSFRKEIWVESIVSRTTLHGELHLLAQFFDRTEQKHNEDALRESEDRLAMALDATALSIWDIDFRTDIVHLDRQWARMMEGVPGVTIITGRELTSLTHPDDVERAVTASLNAIKGASDHFQAESRLETASGNWKWIKCSGKVVERDTDGRAVRAIGTNLDVTERRTADEKIRELAYYDTVTNLPNRRLMLDRLNQALAQSKRSGDSLAVMFLDLDHFKHINDTLGHDAGDEVLKTVAGFLVGCVRTGDTVSRQGGDEFVIVLTKIRVPADASCVAEKILKVLQQPVRISDQELKLTVSIGVSVYPLNGIDDAHDLVRKADIAMYAAKKAGRNRYRIFETDKITVE
jgi:diguanylate cyclase (GGDEF)-like protein/PAS domain S-box-containing protein